MFRRPFPQQFNTARAFIACVCVLAGRLIVAVSACTLSSVATVQAEGVPSKLAPVSIDAVSDQLQLDREIWQRRGEMLWGALRNIWYLSSADAEEAYQHFEANGISRTLVMQSLMRFFELLLTSNSFDEFGSGLRNEFTLYRSPGKDGQGTVLFTAYFRPVYQASRIRTPEYRYPIFTVPKDFANWPKPHPTRVALEGYDGLGGPETLLHGREMAWFKSRYEAFMIHLQGSAILEFPDKTQQAVGFAAGTEHPFRGVSKDFLRKHNVRWDRLGEFFGTHPELLNQILSRNNRFIFFKEHQIAEPVGSLGVPIIGGRSIATDKLKLPPGALGVIRTRMPEYGEGGKLTLKLASRIVFDHDTGSAIKGPGRVDVYMGTGHEAMRKASSVFGSGELFYLFLRNTAHGVTSHG